MSNLFKAVLLLGCLLWQSSGLASDTGGSPAPERSRQGPAATDRVAPPTNNSASCSGGLELRLENLLAQSG